MRSRISMSIQSRAFVFCLIKVLSKVFSFLPLFSLQRARAIMREHSHADAAASPALWSQFKAQVQCCLALTLTFKHRLRSLARRYGVWCSNQCTLSMADIFTFTFIWSISCLLYRWGAVQISHSMKVWNVTCYFDCVVGQLIKLFHSP